MFPLHTLYASMKSTQNQNELKKPEFSTFNATEPWKKYSGLKYWHNITTSVVNGVQRKKIKKERNYSFQ